MRSNDKKNHLGVKGLNPPIPARDLGARGVQSAINAQELLANSAAVLLDWDGCVAFGDRPSPEAVRFLHAHRERVAIVSNNSTHLPEDFALILEWAGVRITPDRIVLAGVEALKRAVESRARRVLILGDGRMKAIARNSGLELVRDQADLVVLLRDTRFSYARLERAANSLRRGARLIVANPDATHPGCNGRLVPETGALLAALLGCVGETRIEMEIIGKPAPRLFERACKALGVRPERAVMIGDNPATDIAGADAFGLASILVGPRAGIGLEHLAGPRAGPNRRAAASR
jgi:4-nitrophenyl phosphatase